MLFTISSNGESDHAKFTNYFNDSVIIKPNSFICYIAGSVVEDLNNTIITIPANTQMTLRFDPLNQFTATIVTATTTYSIREFKDKLNEVFGSLTLHIKNAFICKVRVDPNDNNRLQLAFNFYTKLTNDQGETILSWILPTNSGQLANEPQQNLNYVTLSNPTLTFDHGYVNPATTNSNNNTMRIDWTSSVAGQNNATPFEALPNYVISGVTYGLGMNQAPNRQSFQLYGDSPNQNRFTYLDRINHHQFTVSACPDTTASDTNEVHHFTIGPSTCDNDVLINDAPINGYASYADRKVDMKFKGDGVLDIDVQRSDTGALEQASTGRFNIGDTYRIGLFQNTDTTGADPSLNAYMPIIINYNFQGQVFWWPGSVQCTGGDWGTANIWNTKTVVFNPAINFMMKNAARDHDASLASLDYVSSATRFSADNSVMGCLAGQGFQNATRNANINGRLRDNGLNEVIDVVAAPTPLNNASEYLRHLPIFRRVDTTTPEPATPNSSKKNIYAIQHYNGFLSTKLPCAFSVVFYAMNDSAVVTLPNSATMTLVGGRNTLNVTQGPVIQIQLGQTFATDIEVFDDAGTGHSFTLTDVASGARVNIGYTTWYQLFYYDNGAGDFDVELVDIVAEQRYQRTGGAGTLGSGRLRNPMTLAGADSTMTLNPAGNYFFGHVCQFRFFQQPRWTGAINTWDTIKAQLVNGYTRFGTDPIMVGAPIESQLVNDQTGKYYSLPDVATDDTNSPFFWCEGFKDANVMGPQFTDILMLQNVKIGYGQRNKNVPANAITDTGVGMTDIEQLHTAISFEDYDAVNQRAIEEVLPVQTVPGPDTPYFDEPAEVSNVALEDEVFNVEITNLPHRSFNGKNHSYDKTIYQLPVETTSKEIQGVKITEHSAEQKVWLPLNNPGEIPLQKLDIQISKEDGKKADNLQEDTHLVIQIEQRDDII